MRKFFEEPAMTVNELAVEDIMTTSGNPSGSGNESGVVGGGGFA